MDGNSGRSRPVFYLSETGFALVEKVRSSRICSGKDELTHTFHEERLLDAPRRCSDSS